VSDFAVVAIPLEVADGADFEVSPPVLRDIEKEFKDVLGITSDDGFTLAAEHHVAVTAIGGRAPVKRRRSARLNRPSSGRLACTDRSSRAIPGRRSSGRESGADVASTPPSSSIRTCASEMSGSDIAVSARRASPW
jgi:hypothetical protein